MNPRVAVTSKNTKYHCDTLIVNTKYQPILMLLLTLDVKAANLQFLTLRLKILIAQRRATEYVYVIELTREKNF